MSNEIVKLPTYEELIQEENKGVVKATDKLNFLLSKEPPKDWVKTNKFANNSLYLPIDKVEYMLTSIFQQWRVEVIDYKQLFNAVSCHIRLHYLNPVTREWNFHDGVGAMQIQTKQGASPAELDQINNNAVMMALPAAKSYAIKDAADHLGKVFGRDLNRKDTMAFTPAYDSELRETIIEDKKARFAAAAQNNNNGTAAS